MPSISSFLFQGTRRLRFGPHRDRARADAELLLMHLLRRDRTWLMAHSSDDIGFDHWKPYYELLQRRYRGEPIQYITGETEFYGLPFRVTPDVLIPRPETELLVEKVLASAASFQAPRIVDVGAGSGAIAVALAHHLPCAAITAIDLSPAALTIARQNAALNAVSSRIRFLKGDLLAPVAHEQFEIVVSNPPYVPTTDRPTLSVEVRDHEPALALFAGPDGLDIYRRLIPQAFAALVPGGFLALEIGFAQSPAIADLLASSGFHQIEFLPDLQSIPRVALAQRP
ncbi:MAG TPA: peptide chain release factor N(5)-glutamine methyltransferase [Terracidiphilus sp.]